MKRTFISILCLFCGLSVFGQSVEENVVRQFVNNLRDWCSTNDTDYRRRAQNQCTDACRVKDKIMEDFATNSGLEMKDYVVPNYLNGFENALAEGTISIHASNVRTISFFEQSYGMSYNSSFVNEERKNSKNFVTVACDILISGVINYNIKDLFYIKKGKIVKITPYVEVIDQNTGKKKVLVDFSDFEDSSTLGFTINHDKNFQVGASVVGQWSWFMCSIDFGVNLDSKKYILNSGEIQDVLNFKKITTDYSPTLFLSITPSAYMKYVSIGCGIGGILLEGKQDITQYSFGYESDGNIFGSYGTNTTDATATALMLRPQIKCFIPVGESCKMSFGGGYNFVPKLKDLNGYHVSIGFHFDFDEWDDLFNL